MAVVLVALKSCHLLGVGRSLAGVQALQGMEEQARELRGHCKILDTFLQLLKSKPRIEHGGNDGVWENLSQALAVWVVLTQI